MIENEDLFEYLQKQDILYIERTENKKEMDEASVPDILNTRSFTNQIQEMKFIKKILLIFIKFLKI